jgi:pimeloyl-ACP methyl ester carboxylesterase
MTERRIVPAPPAWLTLLEQRAILELGGFMAASPVLRLIGRGDRHPVLVLPGFTASDRSTVPLRWMLRGQGYWVHGWQLGQNLGPTPRVVDGLVARLHEVHQRQGRKVSIVGWSLGGIYARELARRHPELVRQVVTLGSPFQMRLGDRSAATTLFEALQGQFDPAYLEPLAVSETDRAPLLVPATAIYSRGDGVVRWYTCLERPGPQRENIEVRGSHTGLGVNPAVLIAVTDRLAQREGTWRPFRAPPGLGHLFPRPEAYRAA